MTGPARQGWECASVWLEPIGSFPPRFLAERRAERGQARIGGREAKRPSGLAFLVGIVDIVVSRVDLDGTHERIVTVSVGVTEAPQVHLPEVEARLTNDDTFPHCPAHAAGTGSPRWPHAGR